MDFLGPAIMVVVLLVLPVVFLVAGGLGAVILGSALQKTVENDHAGSEFVDLNR
jgi:hypothetical protein